jgi:Tol biopolymer transport system component
MKLIHTWIFYLFLCSLLVIESGAVQRESFPVLKGPYLGQTPPGMRSEVFAPGIISTPDLYEMNSIFSPRGDEFYYVISTTAPEEKAEGVYFYVMMQTRLVNGTWTKPEQVPFSEEFSMVDIAFSPDGNRLYFCSDKPSPWTDATRLGIWYVERNGGRGWSEWINVGPPINSKGGVTQPTFTSEGTMVFPSMREEGFGGVDIYSTELKNEIFSEPVNLGPAINTKYDEGNSFVSPDGSHLLFARWGMPESLDGGKGMYISFKNKDGSWTQAMNTRPTTDLYGSLAALTPDGKFLFYSREGDIYWVDARIIDTLREKAMGEGGEEGFGMFQGPYLGQECPKAKAEVFLDGVISKLEEPEMCAAFTRDGKEFYFNRLHDGRWTIFFTREERERWIAPQPVAFASGFTDRDFTLSPDGQRIYFGSNRPHTKEGMPREALDIWVSHRLETGEWGEPKNLGAPINTDRSENYPSQALNGNLYFFSSRGEGMGGCEIYMSAYEGGKYRPVTALSPAVNSPQHDWDAFIAPDERFIVFSSQNRPDTLGKQDLYISFRDSSGGWLPALNMGNPINSNGDEICPSVSLDGKYLFFTSRRRGKADIFWIDAGIIEELESGEKH